MKTIKNFEAFIVESVNEEANILINEGILDFTSKEEPTTVDVDELTKVQTDVLSKYDLPKNDIENIKSRISDAISKKIVKSEIKSK